MRLELNIFTYSTADCRVLGVIESTRLQLLDVKVIASCYFDKGIFDVMTHVLGLTCCQEVQLLGELLVEHDTWVLSEDPLEWLEWKH